MPLRSRGSDARSAMVQPTQSVQTKRTLIARFCTLLTARKEMNKYIFFTLLLTCSVGCVTKKTAILRAQESFENGYSLGISEYKLERLNLILANNQMQEELRQKEKEADERYQRSNPYAVRPPELAPIELWVPTQIHD